MPADFIGTIDSDDEAPQLGESSSPRGRTAAITSVPRGKADPPQRKHEDLNPDFEFDSGAIKDGGLDLWGDDELQGSKKGNEPINVDDIIERRTGRPVEPFREKRKRAVNDGEEDEASDSDGDEDDGEDESEGSRSDDEGPINLDGQSEGDRDVDELSEDEDGSEDEGGDDEEVDGDEDGDMDESDADAPEDDDASLASDTDNPAEAARKAAFFAEDPTASTSTADPSIPASFNAMNLSRPLLRALTALKFTNPTPIQARAIPLALLGRDILGSAVTGSGKTAAFMVPILERLCYRDRGRGGQACRVLVLCPTRELAVQCEAVGRALAEKGGMDVRFALLVGGLSLNAQAHTLRTLPDILIATPGRLIDHLTNTPSFTLSALDVLVIDEADRMLEQGFTDELEEIIRQCPHSRQTMLFSATMTDSVDELVKLSLDKPIRVFVDPKRNTAKGLTQEFVRIRTDDARSPSLLALCRRTIRERCIIFFRSKALAHQMRVIFGLCGLKAAELHGNLTQEQRLQALNDFKSGRVDYLLATDLASRGLDIKGVETVINYDMPGQLAQYTHRVGRTARAGRKGRSISLVGEQDRKMLKAVIKSSREDVDAIRHRVVPADAVKAMKDRLKDMEEEVKEVLQEEKEEKAIRQADMELKKGQNMVEHEAEIYSRPARTWFQSEKEKQAAKTTGKETYISSFPGQTAPSAKDSKPAIKRGKYDGLSRKAKRRKMAIDADEAEGLSHSTNAAIRAAKRGDRPVKITEPLARREAKGKGGKGKKRPSVGAAGAGGGGGGAPKGGKRSAFDTERGAKRGGAHEGMRAKPVKVGLNKGAKSGKGGKGGKGKGRR